MVRAPRAPPGPPRQRRIGRLQLRRPLTCRIPLPSKSTTWRWACAI